MSSGGYPQFYSTPPASGAPRPLHNAQATPGMHASAPYMPPPPTGVPPQYPSGAAPQSAAPAYGQMSMSYAPPPTHYAPPSHALPHPAPLSAGAHPGPPTPHVPAAPISQPTMPTYVGGSAHGTPTYAQALHQPLPAGPAYAPPPGPPPPPSHPGATPTSPFSYGGAAAMPPPPMMSVPPPPASAGALGSAHYGPPPSGHQATPAARLPEPPVTAQPRVADRRGNSRIDPAHMPRPVRNPEPVVYETRNPEKRPPPPSTDVFMAVDNGNCSPRSMRATMYSVPATSALRQDCGVPLACVCTPLADPAPGEEPIPVVDLGGDGPIRCLRCRCYINPFVTWLDQGNKWNCNLCGHTNATPAWYYCSLDGSGQRRDRSIHQELCNGSVDFVATSEYCVRPLQEPVYVFVVDVSEQALQTGFTHAALRSLRQALNHLPGGSRARVGILTFGSHVNFYTVKHDDTTSADPVQLHLSDIDEPFCAIPPEKWILDVATKANSLQLLIDSIPLLATYHTSASTSPAAGVAAAVDSLAQTGGRIYIMSASHPSIGFGRLRSRELGTASDEHLQYTTPEDFARLTKDPQQRDIMSQYEYLAQQAVEHQICVEVFVHSQDNSHKDLSSLAYLAAKTGGQTHYFVGDLSEPTTDKQMCLASELVKSVSSIRGNEAVLKLRCGTGLKLERYVSVGSLSLSGEVDLAGLQSTTSMTCLLTHDGNMKNQTECFVQLAVLYTTPEMQRRVRVHNLALNVTAVPTNLFKDADMDACAVMTLHQLAELQLHKGAVQAKQWLETTVVNTLLKYREQCSAHSAKTQLILPESLKLLPLYALGMLKQPMLLYTDGTTKVQPGEGVSTDERAYCLYRLLQVPVEEAIKLLYPRLYPVGLEFENGEGLPDMLGEVVRYTLPRALSSTSELLDSEGMFILDDGRYLYLYIGRNFSSDGLRELFGIESNARPSSVAFTDNEQAKRISNIVQELRRGWSTVPSLRCVWPDVQFGMFALRLVEDSIRGQLSYVDYLVGIHAKIQEKLK